MPMACKHARNRVYSRLLGDRNDSDEGASLMCCFREGDDPRKRFLGTVKIFRDSISNSHRCTLHTRRPFSALRCWNEQFGMLSPESTCPRNLPIPHRAALAPLQSNKVYLPRMHQRLDRTFSARQTNAIRCALRLTPAASLTSQLRNLFEVAKREPSEKTRVCVLHESKVTYQSRNVIHVQRTRGKVFHQQTHVISISRMHSNQTALIDAQPRYES